MFMYCIGKFEAATNILRQHSLNDYLNKLKLLVPFKEEMSRTERREQRRQGRIDGSNKSFSKMDSSNPYKG